MSASLKRKLIWAAATDRTFRQTNIGGRPALAGKCIHCRRAIIVALDAGRSSATLEHIVPRNHGGTDSLDNLALACAGCNQGKGSRLDHRRFDDAKLQEVIATLQKRRAERRREPPEGWPMPDPLDS